MEHLMTLAALGFAAYRGTQLIVWDSILDRWRKRLELWRIAKFDSRARKFVWDLVSCTYCTGWWVSVITLAAYYVVTGWSGVDVLSFGLNAFVVAGFQALLNRIDDVLPGHNPKGN